MSFVISIIPKLGAGHFKVSDAQRFWRNPRSKGDIGGRPWLGTRECGCRRKGFEYLSITGHKIGSPKGIGALFIRKAAPYSPYLFGGHQERERRGGTEAVASIVGLAAAVAQAIKRLRSYEAKLAPLRNKLQETLLQDIEGVEVTLQTTFWISRTQNVCWTSQLR